MLSQYILPLFSISISNTEPYSVISFTNERPASYTILYTARTSEMIRSQPYIYFHTYIVETMYNILYKYTDQYLYIRE